jgi:2-polyprenyl-6-methoxyphenol hydroxylase-like FAD-dependent oxidoreductase
MRTADRLQIIDDWNQLSLLVVQSARVKRWHQPGVLLIGDAAHVMSPVYGVGINYAIQDAVVATNILAPRLLRHDVRSRDLAAVQRRRELPTRIMQWMQNYGEQQSVDEHIGVRQRTTNWFLNSAPMNRLRMLLIAFGGLRPERVAATSPSSKVWSWVPIMPSWVRQDYGSRP